MIGQEPIKSRLEVNFTRLMNEAEKIASGNKNKDWKFEKNVRRILVMFGSQTGTAEEVAERIGREALKYYFDPSVFSMNEFTIESLSHEMLVIFVTSTTGQGDDPDNMKIFFQSLWENRQKRNFLNKLNFGVLGLGDSSYQKFNYSAKRLNKLLLFLGATPLINIGLADDQHDLGPDFIVDSWLKNLWEILLKIFPLPDDTQPIKDASLLPPSFLVQFVEKKDEAAGVSCLPSNPTMTKVCKSQVTFNCKKTSDDHFQDVRLIEFDVSVANYLHKPGDVLMVQPQNLDDCVEEFINTLNIDSNKLFYLIPSKNKRMPESYVLPQPCSVRECIKNYLDIMSIPKRYFFELLSFFTTDENEKEKFLEFASSEGQEELYNYCNRPRRSFLEVLLDFPHTSQNIPFQYLFDLIPSIKPRAYSIASSSKVLPGKAQILMSVVEYKTILKRPRLGLCSNWLAQLQCGSRVYLWFKPGSLTFPDPTKKCPVIMIGPGTGCAPFRSYIQERVANDNCDSLVMIFGCRAKNKDYFFKDEWESLHKAGKLTLLCAFSRDQEEKVYVQHVMKENYSTLWKYIGKNEAKIYYAGNAKRIPIDVYEALQYICEKSLKLDKNGSEEYMKRNLEKKYQTESWA